MSTLIELARATIDLFFPPCCGGCGAALAGGVVCPSCAPYFERVASPKCPVCSQPFEGAGGDHLCHRCALQRRSFDSTVAAFLYAGPAADGLRALKYGPRPERIQPLAELWRQAASRELPEVDLAVPVPLHAKRLRRRGFNQAALLAKPLLRFAAVPLRTSALVRVRFGPEQAGLKGRERRRAPRGAFVVPPRQRRSVQGRRVLVVDDVMTTGATAGACATALRRAGASEVHVAVFARAQ